jgi:ribosomal protein L35
MPKMKTTSVSNKRFALTGTGKSKENMHSKVIF